MKKKIKKADPCSQAPLPSPYLDLLSVNTGRARRRLTGNERENLIMMLAGKTEAHAFDIDRLAPEGSFIKAMLRHFEQTDISFAMPLFQLVMVAVYRPSENLLMLQGERWR